MTAMDLRPMGMKARERGPAHMQDAPAAAMRLDLSHLALAAPKSKSPPDTKSREISILARTPDPINHWYWGQLVHDFAGLEHKDRIVLDYCHSDEDLIGFADNFVINAKGLWLNGRIESTRDDDMAETVLKRADKGIPYEGSIYFAPIELEYIPEGVSTQVNNVQITGEAIIVRKWALRACSVCPHGYDYGTESMMSAEASAASVPLKWKGDMTATTPTATEADVRAQLKQFTDRFGAEAGVNYFNAGKSLADATAEHLGKLTTAHAEHVAKLSKDHADAIGQLEIAHKDAIEKLTKERDEALKAKTEVEGRLSAARTKLGEGSSIDTSSASSGKPATSVTEALAAARAANK